MKISLESDKELAAEAIDVIKYIIQHASLYVLIFVVVYMFRNEIHDILKRFIVFKFGSTEIHFKYELEKIAEQISANPAIKKYTFDRSKEENNEDIIPNALIIESWKSLELTLRNLAYKLGYLDTKIQSPHRLIEILYKELDRSLVDTLLPLRSSIQELLSIRNKVAHENQFYVSKDTAQKYRNTVSDIIQIINAPSVNSDIK